MDWLKTVTPYRIEGTKEQTRTEFERDQDRIIFSVAFKKLNDSRRANRMFLILKLLYGKW